MSPWKRSDYIRLVEETYFGNVSRADIPAVLACFTPDANVVIYHGDRDPRRYRAAAAGEGEHLSTWYAHLTGNFEPRFTEFHHYVDVEAQRCAATFLVTLTPRPGSPLAVHGIQRLRNCNFFDCRDGRIAAMTVYYANPAAAPAMPTGYPS